jgi:hypothetical protein
MLNAGTISGLLSKLKKYGSKKINIDMTNCEYLYSIKIYLALNKSSTLKYLNTRRVRSFGLVNRSTRNVCIFHIVVSPISVVLMLPIIDFGWKIVGYITRIVLFRLSKHPLSPFAHAYSLKDGKLLCARLDEDNKTMRKTIVWYF